jgi:hypothetical protein
MRRALVAGQVERHVASLAGQQSDHLVSQEAAYQHPVDEDGDRAVPHIRICHLPGGC